MMIITIVKLLLVNAKFIIGKLFSKHFRFRVKYNILFDFSNFIYLCHLILRMI